MEQRVDGGVAAQRRGSVGARVAECALGLPTPLESEDRLTARHPLCDPREVLRIAERLHVQHYRGRPVVLLPALEQVAGRNIGAVAERHEHRHPQPPSGRMTQQRDTNRARGRAHRQTSRPHAHAGERSVQADLGGGVQHPQGTRADHPQARAPNDLEQPVPSRPKGFAPFLLTTSREHEQRSGPPRRCLGGEREHLIARGGDDHQLRWHLEIGEAPRSPQRAHHTPGTVDRRHDTLKAARDDVRQHRPAEIARRGLGANNGHRRGRENRPQGCDRGEMVALVDPLHHRLRGSDIQRHPQVAKSLAPHSEPGVLEHVQHQPVAGRHFGIEAMDPTFGRDLRKLLEHPRPDPAALLMISHRKRNLGDAGLAQPVIAGDRHHTAIVSADQSEAINPSRLRVRARHSVGAAKAVERNRLAGDRPS